MIGRIGRKGVATALVALALAATMVAAHAATRDFIWKVTGKGGTVYLVGSVHVLSKDSYPLSPALDAAFKTSDVLVEETDLDALMSPDIGFAMLTSAALPEGQTLDTVLPRETYELLRKHLADADMPIEPLKRMKPWFIALMLETAEWEKAGFDANLGLDKHFYDLAKADGKETQGLESAEFQISLFTGLTPDQEAHMLAGTLKDLDNEIENIGKMADAWKAGDAPAAERILVGDLKSDPVLYRLMLVDRNRTWIPKIEALFSKPNPSFVVVGAAHLLGPDGLVAQLKARGYRAEQQ